MSAGQVSYEQSFAITERDRLLLEHLPQVRFIARRIHDRLPQHVDIEDLINSGVIGLIDALSKYDSTKNVQFKSYAQFRIRGAILDSLRDLDWSPRELRKQARRVEEANRQLSTLLGRAATDQEIAAELGVSLEAYQHLRGELRGLEIGSLHEKAGESGLEEDICAYEPGVPVEDPFVLCMRTEMKRYLVQCIGQLSEKERLVLSLYYFEELTMKEISQVMGVVESRVSQIHSSAVLKLRAKLTVFGTAAGRPSPSGAEREFPLNH